MSKHSKYSASQISRIIRCPGSIDFVDYLINKDIVPNEETSVYAEEGTLLHDQTERKIQGKPFNTELNAEQEAAIQYCIDFLEELRTEHNLTWIQTERRVTLEGYDIMHSGGTADIIAGNHNRTLHILDWKYGQGVPVFVEKNEQLMTYLAGAAVSLDQLTDYEELWIHVCQPRLDYTGSYKVEINELVGLLNAIKNAQKSHKIAAGEIQCLWCRGKNHCVEYEEMVQGKAAVVFEVHDIMQRNEFSFEHAKKVLKYEPFFKKVFKAVKDEMNSLSGQKLKELGLKRVAGRSFRKFQDKDKVTAYLLENYGDVEDIYKESELKSPAQIEKAFPGLKKDPEWQKLVIKPLGAPTIVDINDKRPEYDSGAESVFAHLKED